MGNSLEFSFCWRLKNMPGFVISFRSQVKSTETIWFSSHSSYMKPVFWWQSKVLSLSIRKREKNWLFSNFTKGVLHFFFAVKCSKSQWHHRKIQNSCNCFTTTNYRRPNIVLLLSVTSLMQSAFIILQVCKE